MNEWLTARDIADLGLPDMPATSRSIQRIAEREGWNDHPSLVRRRLGRGGGLEYHYHLLPMLARMAYVQRTLEVGAPANDDPVIQEALEAPNDAAALQRDARLAIVHAFSRFARGLPGLKQASHLQMFADRYRTGSIKVDPWVKDAVPSFSKRTLLRWISATRKGARGKLAVDRGAARRGRGVLDTANGGKVKEFVLATIAHQPFLSGAHVRTMVRSEFGDKLGVIRRGAEVLVDVPPERTFQHFLKGLKSAHKAELTKLTNPDRFRSTMKLSGTNALSHIQAPNQLWQIDASPVDAVCIDGRHSIYVCVDIATRRTCLLVSKTPRAASVALLIRKALLDWGVPETIKTDNGSDFVANDTKRLFAALGIEADVSTAYSPEQKGHVERLIGTFQHDFATLLPGFVGHSVADRKQIEERKSFAARLGERDAETFGVELSGADLQDQADKWAELIYHQRSHRGLKGETPFAAATRLAASRREVDERALDVLLMPVSGKNGIRTTTKFGIRIEGFHYLAPNMMPGKQVLVRMDPADKGRVLLFEPDGQRYLGEAICPELSGIDPKTFVKAARELQGEMIEDATRTIRRNMKRIAKGPTLIERALDVAARDMPNVVPLRPRGDIHETAALKAASTALDGNRNAVEDTTLDRAREKLIADMERDALDRAESRPVEAKSHALAENIVTLPETPKDRYRRAVNVALAIAEGMANPDDALWLGGYQTTAEYRAQKRLHDDFGDAYLAR